MIVRRASSSRRVLVPGVLLLGILVAAGCAKAPKPVPVTEWMPLADAYFPVKFEHPKDWHVVSEGTRVLVYSSPDAMAKFHDWSAQGVPGVELSVSYEKQESPGPLAGYVDAFSKEQSGLGYDVSAATPTKLDGEDAMSVQLSGNVDKKTKLRTTRIFTMKDGTLYYVQYSAHGDLYDFYAPVRDRLISSFKLPAPVVASTSGEPAPPSAEMTSFSNAYLTISHPANFQASTPGPRGEVKFSLELRGDRMDSDVRVDLFPAKGLTVEKVFDQNSKLFKGAGSKGEATISGVKAMFINYTPASGVRSRAYYLVKNDQVCRVIMNYYQPMQAVYLPAFEKVVQSLALK